MRSHGASGVACGAEKCARSFNRIRRLQNEVFCTKCIVYITDLRVDLHKYRFFICLDRARFSNSKSGREHSTWRHRRRVALAAFLTSAARRRLFFCSRPRLLPLFLRRIARILLPVSKRNCLRDRQASEFYDRAPTSAFTMSKKKERKCRAAIRRSALERRKSSCTFFVFSLSPPLPLDAAAAVHRPSPFIARSPILSASARAFYFSQRARRSQSPLVARRRYRRRRRRRRSLLSSSLVE